MDILSSLTSLINSQSSGLIAGMIAALTPCALAMIPVALYAFGLKKDSKVSLIKVLGLFLITFVASFTLFGFILQSLLSGTLVNVSRIVIGFSLILAAFIATSGTSLAGWLQNFKSPILIGFAMPLAISLSPCVLPWLALNTNRTDQFIPTVLFGIGLTIPSTILAFLGNKGYAAAKNIKKFTHYLDIISPLLLIVAGIYMLFQLMMPTNQDLLLAQLFVFIVYLLILFNIYRVKVLRTLYNFGLAIIILIAQLGILVVSLPITSKNSALSAFEVKNLCHNVVNPEIATANHQVAFMFTLTAVLLGFWWMSRHRRSSSLVFEA